MSEAYAGHAAELAAQAREHEEAKQLALAGQRASFEGKTPTKKKKTDKLVEKAFADRQTRHDDAIKSLRRSHDAKLVALKASHAKELTMVKTADPTREGPGTSCCGQQRSPRGGEDTYGTDEGAHVCH